MTLIDREDSGLVGTFSPPQASENWFHLVASDENKIEYVSLELCTKEKCVKFTKHDGFGGNIDTKSTPSILIIHHLG